MIISCEQCATRFRLDSYLVRPDGTKVRCSKCRHIFVAFPAGRAAADVPVDDGLVNHNLGLDNLEDDPINKIDADLKAGGFLGEALEASQDALSNEIDDWSLEDKEIPDLADELDKILGTDDVDDSSVFDDTEGDLGLDVQGEGETGALGLAELSDSLDDLFSGEPEDENTFNGDAAIHEVTTEDLITEHEDIDVLDLSSLDDDLEGSPLELSKDDLLFEDDGDALAVENDDLDFLEEALESAQDELSDDSISLADKTVASDDDVSDDFSLEALEKAFDEAEDSDIETVEEDDLIIMDEDDGSTDDDTPVDEIPFADDDAAADDDFSMEALEKALDEAEATEGGLDFDLSGDSDDARTDPELEVETDPDLDMASLIETADEDSEKVGTDKNAFEVKGDDIDDVSPVKEESLGLDTVQIEDFELDLENLDEVDSEAAIESSAGDSDNDLTDIELPDANDLEGQAEDVFELDLEEADESPVESDELKEASLDDVESEIISALEDSESIPEKMEAVDLDLDSLDLDTTDLDTPDLDTTGAAETVEVDEDPSSISDELESVEDDLNENEDFSLDTNQIQLFDDELDGLKELESNGLESAAEDSEDGGEDFSFDTEMIEAVDGELDNLEALITPDEEDPLEEITDEGLATEDGPTETAAALLSEDDETIEGMTLDPEESFALDTLQIASFDQDIESLEEVAPTVSEPDTESDDVVDGIELNLDDIEGLDLEVADVEERDLGGDDFVLDSSMVESLDFESIDEQPTAEAVEMETEATDDDLDLVLDEEQIESLNLDLESTEMPEGLNKDGAGDASDKGPAVAGKKTADVLNLDLERPDLDGSGDLDDGVDLPVLDDLLAPAEVVDDTLVDDEIDLDTDGAPEESAGATDDDFNFDDQLELDSPVLDLDDLDDGSDDVKVNDGQALEPAVEPELALGDDQKTEDLSATDEPVTVSPTPLGEDGEPGPKTMGDLKDIKEPMPPGRFEPGPKKKTSKLLLALLVIALLLGLLFGLNSMGVKIPGLDQLNISSLLPGGGQPVDDLGQSQIKTADINGKFVSNKDSGRLFVVTGQVLNQYDTRRGDIQLRGTVYATGGKQVATQNVFNGKVISDEDLKTKPVAEIKKHLGIIQNSGQSVDPGKTSPFMIVFDGLPENIEEFSVEIVRSKAQ